MTAEPPSPTSPLIENQHVEAVAVLAGLACTNTALRRAARHLGQVYDDALAPVGLTASQARLLWEVSAGEAAGGPTLQTLADHLSVQTSAVTHALRPLVRDGLVAVRPDSEDRRSKRAVLTAEGQARLGRMAVLWLEANGRVEAALGPDGAARLRALADAVASPAFPEPAGHTDASQR